jgi:hypothetical protein
MPVILATQEAEIRRTVVQSQPGQIVRETVSRKNLHKNRAGGVAQGEGPEYCKKKPPKNQKNKIRNILMCPALVVYGCTTQETEIRRIEVQSQPGQIVCQTLSRKNPSHISP